MMNKKRTTALSAVAALGIIMSVPAYASASSDLTVPAVGEATVATPTAPKAPTTPTTPSVSSGSSTSSSGSSNSSSSSSSSQTLSQRLVNVAGFSTAKQFTGYYINLQRAVANGNRDAVAKRVSFPLTVNTSNGARRSILNEKQFLNEYTSIMTTSVRQTLAKQNVNDVLVNARGVSIGNGTLWISPINDRPGIYAVNQ
ncbi:hypothetical protein [Paenibacillus sp. WLX2291]|uniref:hypothetical protein n=1 Tax=Paenibacillus sp. WLX2291 TaxID=3296934 RepID=UPI00398450E5